MEEKDKLVKENLIDDCIFCKIIKGEIPADIVYENDMVIGFKDINPVAKFHIVVIPKYSKKCRTRSKTYTLSYNCRRKTSEV